MHDDNHGKVTSVLLLNYLDLPKPQQFIIRELFNFGNDRYIEYVSEMSPTGESDGDTWAKTLTTANIQAYYADQCATNDYAGDYEQFLSDYGIVFDVWLLDQGFDLNVATVLIRISW